MFAVLNKVPEGQHGGDIMRMREAALSGWAGGTYARRCCWPLLAPPCINHLFISPGGWIDVIHSFIFAAGLDWIQP